MVWQRRGVWLLAVLVLVDAALAARYYVSSASGANSATCGGAPGTGACKTLDYAIDRATDGDTLALHEGDYTISALMTKSLTISGLGRFSTYLTCKNDFGRALTVTGNASVTLSGIHIFHESCDAFESDFGGCIFANESATVTLDTVVLGHCAASRGGAVAGLGSATVILRGSNLENNTATVAGGAVYLQDFARGYFYDSVLDDNEVDHLDKGVGGGVALLNSAAVTMERCVFSKNTAAEAGGDLNLQHKSSVLCMDSVFSSSFVQVGLGLVLHSTGFSNITFSNSRFLDSACGFGDCVASFLFTLPSQPEGSAVPSLTMDGCTFDQPKRPQMQPLRSLIFEASAAGGTPEIAVDVSSSYFLSGRETFFFFNGIESNCHFREVTFIGARAVAHQKAAANFTVVGAKVYNTTVEFGGGFMQITCMTQHVPCNAWVTHSIFDNVGSTAENTYGGVFALSGQSSNLWASNLTVTYPESSGMAATRGGVFAVLNGATVYLSDSSFQSQASYGGVFYLGPVLVPWALSADDAALEQDKATVHAERCKFYLSRGIEGGAVVDANTGKVIERPTSKFFATDCDFRRCHANGEGGVVTTWFGLEMWAERCTFEHNYAVGSDGGGGVISVAEASNLTFTDCHFRNNSATHTGGMLLAKNDAMVKFNGGSVVEGYAKSGGVFYLKQDARVEVQDAVFERNHAEIGGVATLIQTGNLVFRNCLFSKNNASTFAGALNAVGSSAASVTDLSVYNSVFQDNLVTNGDGGVLSLGLSASSEFRNCTILRSSASQNGGAVYVNSAANFIVRDSEFRDGSAKAGGALFATGGTHVIAYDTEFTGNKATVGGAFASAGIAATTLVRPKLASNSATALGGSLYAAGRSTVNFTKGTTKFSTCALGETAVGYGGVFYAASFASFSVMDSTFYDQSVNGFGGVSATIGNAKISFNRCLFNVSWALTSGAFSLDTSSELSVLDSQIYGSYATRAGGVVGASFTGVSTFTNTLIVNSTSNKGGVAAFEEGSSGVFRNTQIRRASAEFGAVFVLADQARITVLSSNVVDADAWNSGGFLVISDDTTATIDGTDISQMHAKYFGGVFFAIAGGSAKFTVTNSKLHSNSAPYGAVANVDSCNNVVWSGNSIFSNYAKEAGGVMYFRSLDDVYSCECTLCTITGNTADGYGSINASALSSVTPMQRNMTNIVSGMLLSATVPPTPPLVVYGLDEFGQRIHVIDTRLVVRVAAKHPELVVGGRTVVTVSPGRETVGNVTFDQVKFTAVPGSTETLEISVIYPAAGGADINLTMGLCKIGQVLPDGSTVCITCKAGTYTFYSTEDVCHSCPIATAHCAGGNQFKVKTGWWRRSKFSNETLECLFGPACLGYPMFPNATGSQVEFIEQTIDYPEGCAPGYRGNLCFGCSYGYGRSGEAGCGKCPSPVVNRLLIAAGIIASIIVMAVLIYRTRKSASDKSDKFMMMIKIFMSYLQFVGLAAGLNIDWPQQLLAYFSIQSGVTSASDRIVSLDCWLRQADSPVGEVFFEMQFVYTMLPIFGVSLILLFWGGQFFYKYFTLKRHVDSVVAKLKSVAIDSTIVSVIVFAFFLHPTITQQTFQMFTCRELFPGEWFLVADLDVQCYTASHFAWMMGVGLFRLVFYVLAIPLGAFFVLYRQRHHLEEQSVRDKYGFLYVGFSVRCYYWEIVIMIRKVCVISIVVFFKQFGTLVQVMLALGLVYMSYVFHIYARPYHKLSKNQLEALHNEQVVQQAQRDAQALRDAGAGASKPENKVKVLADAGAGSTAAKADDERSALAVLARARSQSDVDPARPLAAVVEGDEDSGNDGGDGDTIDDSLGMEELDRLEQWSLLATLGTFYFGYFLNAETINDAGKIALSVLIFLINGCFLMVFFLAIKKEFVRKAKELARTVKSAKKQIVKRRHEKKNRNRRRLPANDKSSSSLTGVSSRTLEMQALPAGAKLPPKPTFAKKKKSSASSVKDRKKTIALKR